MSCCFSLPAPKPATVWCNVEAGPLEQGQLLQSGYGHIPLRAVPAVHGCSVDDQECHGHCGQQQGVQGTEQGLGAGTVHQVQAGQAARQAWLVHLLGQGQDVKPPG